jgi:hypothetical protein
MQATASASRTQGGENGKEMRMRELVRRVEKMERFKKRKTRRKRGEKASEMY